PIERGDERADSGLSTSDRHLTWLGLPRALETTWCGPAVPVCSHVGKMPSRLYNSPCSCLAVALKNPLSFQALAASCVPRPVMRQPANSSRNHGSVAIHR